MLCKLSVLNKLEGADEKKLSAKQNVLTHFHDASRVFIILGCLHGVSQKPHRESAFLAAASPFFLVVNLQ